MYVGRVWLGYTEEQLWSLTPRQFDAQLKVHLDLIKTMRGGTTKPTTNPVASFASGFIDQIPGW